MLPTLQPGDLVADKYRVEGVLAQGGMGVVVVARHEALDQRVAVKVLRADVATDKATVARFLREAQAAARIQSEHICRVFDVGTLPDGAPYMVMELLEGVDLAGELERGALRIADAVTYAAQALDGIVEAHRRGIVHRDLKPANIFLARRDDGRVVVKVLDFGISKIEQPSDAQRDFSLTSTQTLLGSPAYMSPEQVRSSKDVDVRTDIWSMGVVLYESLSGGSLFGGETLGEVFARIREDPIPKLSSKRPDVPADLEQIVHRCLERKIDARFATAAELRDALIGFLERTPGAPRSSLASLPAFRPAQSGAAMAQTESLSTLSGELPVRPVAAGAGSRSRTAMLAVGALVIVGVGAGGWAFLGRSQGVPGAMSTDAGAPLAVATQAAPSADPRPPPVPSVIPGETASAMPSASASTAQPAPSVSARAGNPKSVPRVKAGGGSLDDVLGKRR